MALKGNAESVGMLIVGMVGSQPKSASVYLAFLQRLGELGYQAGNNFAFEFIQAVKFEDYAPSFRELVQRNVSILVASGTEIALKSALAASDTLNNCDRLRSNRSGLWQKPDATGR